AFAALLLFSVVAVIPAYALSPLSFTDGSTFSSLNSGRWQHVWDDDSNYAIAFNATLQQYLQAANNTVYDVTNANFWMAGMFKIDSLTGAVIVDKKNNFATASAGYSVRIGGSGNSNFIVDIADGVDQGGTLIGGIQAGVWYSWDVDRNGNTLTIRLYNHNTATLSTNTDDISDIGSMSNTEIFTVGRRAATGANFFPGQMDNLITPQLGQTLTEEQFLEFATTGKISGITPTSFYGFNEGAAGATILDRFGSNNLTPFNSPTYTTDVPSSRGW